MRRHRYITLQIGDELHTIDLTREISTEVIAVVFSETVGQMVTKQIEEDELQALGVLPNKERRFDIFRSMLADMKIEDIERVKELLAHELARREGAA